MYCKRKGLPEIEEALRRTGILVNPVTKYLLSKRKGKHEPQLLREYLELHQDSALELKSLRLVVENQGILPVLIGKTRPAKKQTFTDNEDGTSEKEGERSSGWYFIILSVFFLFVL